MSFICTRTETDPFGNLALEAYLCKAAVEMNRPILYLWQNRPCVVIGRNQNPWLECDLSAMDADNVLLVRRKTGGGAVYHDLGNLNYSFCLPESLFDEERQYRVVLAALASLGITAERNGRNDLTINGKKISGSAFLHSEGAALHHGTLLIQSDLAVFGRYLTPDTEKFTAKGVKSVSARVGNLADISKAVSVAALRLALADAFAAEYGASEPCCIDDNVITGIYDEFSAWEFRYGKTPKFDLELRHRFPFGRLTLLITVAGGLVDTCSAYSDMLDTQFPQLLAQALVGARLTDTDLATAAANVCGAEYVSVVEWLQSSSLPAKNANVAN